jgi:hypothetical protein
MSFPSTSQRESAMKESVDEDEDVVLLHLHWNGKDLV